MVSSESHEEPVKIVEHRREIREVVIRNSSTRIEPEREKRLHFNTKIRNTEDEDGTNLDSISSSASFDSGAGMFRYFDFEKILFTEFAAF